jgi:hypothetical protein
MHDPEQDAAIAAATEAAEWDAQSLALTFERMSSPGTPLLLPSLWTPADG